MKLKRLLFILPFILCSCFNIKRDKIECDSIDNLVFTLHNNHYSVKAKEGAIIHNIHIPDKYDGKKVTKIDDYGFADCCFLASIIIPKTVISIGSAAFQNCSSLNSIEVDKRNHYFDSRNNCNAIIETSTNELIYGCKNTIIPNSVTSIGTSAFESCSSLTSITIPNSVTSIGTSAFESCSSLTSITIPNSVTSIGTSAFYNCSSLTSVNIPNSVKSIETSAFQRCYSLSSITIPNSVTSIETFAFCDCSSLTSVNIPNSVHSIETLAFVGCSSLTSVNIPNSVIKIGSSAFAGCSSLSSITIPNSVIYIGSAAFSRCTLLTIYCEAHKEPSLWEDDWNCDSCKVVWSYCDK